MNNRIIAVFVTAILAAGCAAPSPEALRDASTGRITKLVPVIIESDSPPGIGSAFAKKTANRPGQRITVRTNDDRLIEVTQDENPDLRVGATVRIEGFGASAKILPP